MTAPASSSSSPTPSSPDEDALLDSLDNDPTLSHLRESRLTQLTHALKTAQHQRSSGYGTLTTLTCEKTLMDTTASVTRCIVHFSKADFARCRIMDKHLEALAKAHLGTKFLKIEVGDAPFLVGKLGVRVLPCVIGFVGGLGVERIVGFEGLGGSGDGFGTGDLERRLVRSGVLEGEMGVEVEDVGVVAGKGVGRKGGGDGDDDDGGDDDEWD